MKVSWAWWVGLESQHWEGDRSGGWLMSQWVEAVAVTPDAGAVTRSVEVQNWPHTLSSDHMLAHIDENIWNSSWQAKETGGLFYFIKSHFRVTIGIFLLCPSPLIGFHVSSFVFSILGNPWDFLWCVCVLWCFHAAAFLIQWVHLHWVPTRLPLWAALMVPIISWK